METRPASRPTYRARIERIFDHADDLRSLFLKTVGAPLPSFIPGMFISISMPLANEIRVRPYTIASSPEDGEPFEVVFNRVPGGAGAAWLFARQGGEEIDFTGPFGAFTLDRAPDAETIFIAEGTAIAPIRPMIRRLLAQNPAARGRLLYVAERSDHLLYREELEALPRLHPRFEVSMTVIAGTAEARWARLSEEARRRWIDGDGERTRHFYICGVGAGVLELRDILRAAGYERRAVHYERW
ncbi:MAG: ferredoxin--NADP reductase [Candidatus Binataceae bacterium]